MALLLRRWLLPGNDPQPEAVATSAQASPGSSSGALPRPPRDRMRSLAILGVLVVMAAMIEDTPASWGAVFLRTELGTSAALAGTVYIGFQVFMTIGRLLGDRAVDRFGEIAVVRVGGVLIAAGMATGLTVGRPAAVIAGFALAGLGAAPLFPLMFNAAANVPGVATGHGLAWIQRGRGVSGFLASPPLVGLIGDASSLRIGLSIDPPAAGVVVVVLAVPVEQALLVAGRGRRVRDTSSPSTAATRTPALRWRRSLRCRRWRPST